MSSLPLRKIDQQPCYRPASGVRCAVPLWLSFLWGLGLFPRPLTLVEPPEQSPCIRLTFVTRISRTIGSVFGMPICNGILWYWWPEAHGYYVNPFGIFLLSITFASDLIYPFLLWKVRGTEKELPDGRLVSGELYAQDAQEGRKKR